MSERSASWRPGQTVCRCCLAEGCYKDISTEYFWMGKREVYADMLLDTFDVNISFSQAGGPGSSSRLICEPCISRLRDASEFKRQVLECEKAFVQQLEPGSSTIDVDDGAITLTGSEIKVEAIKLEKSLSDDEDFHDAPNFDDDDDDLDDQPLTTYASRVPKKESVDILELLDTEKTAEKRKMPVRSKATSAKKLKAAPKTVVAKAATSKTATKTGKVDTKKKGSAAHSGLSVKWKTRRLYSDSRHNASIILQNSNVCPFRCKSGVFVCAYCSLTFGDFAKVREHSKEHATNLEAIRQARTYEDIKIDVSNLECKICSTNISNLESLKEHLTTEHGLKFKTEYGLGVIPYILDRDKYSCSMCSETFIHFSSLNTHMNNHSPANICFHCGKSFAAAQRLKAHLAIHDNSKPKYKCAKCNEEFSTRVARNNHSANVHGKELRYRCPYCEEGFKSYLSRAKHLKKAHGSKIEYPCNLCSSVFTVCNQRTKHIRQVHEKILKFQCNLCSSGFVTASQLRNHEIKHTSERPYQCEVCKKAYARMKTLKEHMRIHNNDRRFVCPVCSSAFVQKCSLKGHMKTHHSNIIDVKEPLM